MGKSVGFSCARATHARARWEHALLRLERVARELPNIQLLGKAEWMNPGGSVKDRAASNIVAEARAAGRLGPGKILLDSTSGNTGIATQ